MSLNISDLSLPPHFSGVVRLFPLPNLVLFPGVVQALHVFEPRYRKMTEDCLASDKLITMSLYREPISETLELSREIPIHDDVCICKVFAQNELEDGRYNLMIAGLSRARIRRELPVEQPYRMAEVDIVSDDNSLNDQEMGRLRAELLKRCRSVDLLSSLTQQMDIKRILDEEIPLSLLVDLIAFVGELDCQSRQEILKLANVELRCWKLIELIGKKPVDSSDEPSAFPPDFSSN